ncbi:hypothetical protein [Actinacidiphila yeochonensis]|uniref:hypothetical protein n=1 Tax=Actinacidiphila yeochonensis TaxID=89050 RepID=UPI00055ECECA|nr:hypothetical protein [Actinacidiphila yeochonensis]
MDFSGVDPAALDAMIRSFDADKDRLWKAVRSYRPAFAALGLDTGPIGELASLCHWMDDQLPDLRRRQRLAAALDGQPQARHLRPVPEPVLSAVRARSEGRALAERFNGNGGGDRTAAAAYHAMAEELAAHATDPDLCSFFYANLRPLVLDELAADLANAGSPTASSDLKVFSRAFATAVSARPPVPGFDKVRKAFLEPLPAHGVSAWAWSRAALLAYGDFPHDFLAAAARANGLDRLADAPDAPQQDHQGDRSKSAALGLPADLIALTLQNLSRNGRAAFDAVAQMGDPKSPDLQGHLALLLTYGAHSDEVHAALGAMIDAAAGVHGSYDPHGTWHLDASYKPTPYEQTFAYCAILAAAHAKEARDFDGNFKSAMGRLAAAYAPEFATAGHVMNGYNFPDSSFGAPSVTGYRELPGIDPAFHLGGTDAYDFLKTFADQDVMTAPFDEAMAELRHRVLVESAAMDKDALLHDVRGGDGTFNMSAKAFGNIARLEFDAMTEVRENMDEQSDAFRENVKAALILPSELAGEPEWGRLATLIWRSGMWIGKEFALTSAINATAASRLADYADEANLEMEAVQRYYAASILVEAGWPTTPIPPSLRDKDGHLKAFDQLSAASDSSKVHDELVRRLQEFNTWLVDQSDPLGTASFHDREEDGSGLLVNASADLVAHEAEANG